MGLKDVALVLGLRVANPSFKPNAIDESTFKDRFFPSAKQVSYREIHQPVFDSRFIKRDRSRDEGLNMPNINFKRMV